MTLGLVCDACDALNPIGASACSACRGRLAVLPGRLRTSTPEDLAVDPSAPVGSSTLAAAAARCPSCGGALVIGHRFCGHCGRVVAEMAASPTVATTSSRPPPARLILIKGDGVDGMAFPVEAGRHLAGRLRGDLVFPEDTFLSPLHATFVYRDGRLVVVDEGSRNGVFLRLRAPITVETGVVLIAGEQLLRIEAARQDTMPRPDPGGTYFYGSPRRPARLTIYQLLAGGDAGMVFRCRADSVSIGREGNDINFPDDPFISGRHLLIRLVEGGRLLVSDLGSKNGTFVRLRGEHALSHGDLVFLGQQLLRVDLSPS